MVIDTVNFDQVIATEDEHQYEDRGIRLTYVLSNEPNCNHSPFILLFPTIPHRIFSRISQLNTR